MERQLIAGYFGMGGNSFMVTDPGIVQNALKRAGFKLLVCTEWDYPPDSDFAHVKWDRNTWRDEMIKCDVILAPQRADVQPAKSAIKVTVAMSLGLPVIATPIQAYKEVINTGINGYLANTEEEWYQALVALQSPEKRKQVGQAGLKSVDDYSLENITKQWISLSKDLLRTKTKSIRASVPQPKPLKSVDLIITSYNNVEYLKLCISSIKLNTTYPHSIIISDAGSGEETWEYLKTLQGFTILGEPGKRLNFSEANNEAIKRSSTDFFVLLNSDVICSKGWLEALMDKMESVDRLAACGVLSNCDIGFLHGYPGGPQYNMTLEKSQLVLRPGMKMEEIIPHIDDLYSTMEKSNVVNKGKYQRQEWVAYYCTIFARSAFNEVGLLDPTYHSGCEDLDHANRLRKSHFEIGQALDSFVFHFGGVSRGHYQKENKEQYDKEDVYNHVVYTKKWYLDSDRKIPKKKIAIWTGPGWEIWSRKDVDSGMAGSETWAAELAAEFSRRGHSVQIFNSCPVDGEVDRDGVIYRDYKKYDEVMAYDCLDVFIASRTCDPLSMNLHAQQKYVMVHDIFISPDPNYDLRDWQVIKYAYLSDWHKAFLIQHHKINPNKLMPTFNGVNQDSYVGSCEKKNQSVYSSSADRGLKELLLMLPEIRKAVPDFTLKVAYGWKNFDAIASKPGQEAMLAFKKEILELMTQPGVEDVGRVDKKTLAKLQMESKVHLMPVWFQETFGIGWVENGLSKNALLTSNLAGLITTVGSAGILLDGFGPYGGPHPQAYRDRFIQESIKLLTDEEYRQTWANKAYDNAIKFTWKNCADAWIKQFGW